MNALPDLDLCRPELNIIKFNKQVRLTLDDEDTGRGVQLVPGTFGMVAPNACTIVIIAGIKQLNFCKQIHAIFR